MKLKKALSGVLAAAMVVTLTPAMAFASTTNTVVSVPTVATDDVLSTDVVISLKNTSGADLTNGTIKISLSNGTFEDNNGVALGDTTEDSDALLAKYIELSTSPTIGTEASMFSLSAESLSDTSAKFTFSSESGLKVEDGKYAYLFIKKGQIKSGTEAGEVSLSIEGLDSTITSGTYTIAVAGDGRTTATVTGNVNDVPRSTIESEAKIELTETSINAIPKDVTTQIIKMTLPKDCTWKGVTVAGGAVSTSVSLTAESIDAAPTLENNSGVTNKLYVLKTDQKIAYLVINLNNLSESKRDTLTITPEYTIGKDTPDGDITVDIVGYKAYNATGSSNKTVSDASGLVIAVYGEENVQVIATEEDNLPQIIAGKLKTNKDKEFKVKVTLKENMKGALQSDRYVDFDFPEEVQVSGKIKYVVSKNTSASMTGNVPDGLIDVETSTDKDASGFSFLVPKAANALTGWKIDTKNTITFEIPVTVEAGYTGDITLNVSGAKAGVDDSTVTVGTVISPISVTATSTDIKTGLKDQAVADITITENIAGYLNDVAAENEYGVPQNELWIGVETLGLSKGIAIASFSSAEVTDGNLEIGKAQVKATNSKTEFGDVDGDAIVIPIKSSSSKASTIVIKDVKLNLNRTMPEGGYELQVGGSAVVENSAYDNGDFTDVAASSEDYAVIVTPADSTVITEKVDAQFVIGQTSYTNNGESVTMDAAPYIANSRTMVPIRYVANACGISENDITWNESTKTATINGLNTVVTIKMGSNTIQTSNGTITMDTVAVNNNGRIYVPLRFIANALGANVAWDASTKTITLTK
jgi:hypothetical protein